MKSCTVFPFRPFPACAADSVCVRVSSYRYIFDNTRAAPVRVFFAWGTSATGVTFTGQAPVLRDSVNNNRPYMWVIVPANTVNYIATTASKDAGSYQWWWSNAQFSGCSTSNGIPAPVSNDVCYRISFEISGRFVIQLSTTQYSPLRVRFTLNPTNAALTNAAGGAAANPFTTTVQGRLPPTGSAVTFRTFGYIVPVNKGVHSWFQFGFSYSYKYGDAAAVHDNTARYAIPWAGARSISQGNGGSFSHQPGTADHYAIDVPMPTGTPLYASRAGYVAFVEESNTKSTYEACPSSPTNCQVAGSSDNYVLVIHNDGTMSRYTHLQYNGGAVVAGQQIAVNQLIGYAGNTGFSTGPHLHFATYRTTDIGQSPGIMSVQIYYANGTPTGFIPQQGQTITGPTR